MPTSFPCLFELLPIPLVKGWYDQESYSVQGLVSPEHIINCEVLHH